MIEKRQYEGNIHELLRWAANRGKSEREGAEPPEPFRSWVVSLLPSNCRKKIGFWVGITTPDAKLTEDGEWVDRFPHIHRRSMGWPDEATTVMTYLIAPEEGGAIAVGGEALDDPYEEIDVEVGMTIAVDAKTWHGVRPVKRGTRIVLLTTGLPE